MDELNLQGWDSILEYSSKERKWRGAEDTVEDLDQEKPLLLGRKKVEGATQVKELTIQVEVDL